MSDNPFRDDSVQQAASSNDDAKPLPGSNWNKPDDKPAASSSGENPWKKPAAAAEDEPEPVADDVVKPANKKIDHRKPWEQQGRPPTQDELRAWEKDLSRREKSYAESDDKLHNWPTWPAPCTRYAPDDDIVLGSNAEERRDWVKKLYYAWFANVFGLFWNFISMCVYVDKKDGDVAMVFLAIVYLLVGAVGSFFGWMKLGYRAAETQSNMMFFMFLIWFGLCGLWWVAVAVGFHQAAMAGMITMLDLYSDSDVGGTLCLVGFVLYCLLSVLHGYLWVEANILFRATGGTEETRKELQKEGAKHAIQDAVV